MAISTQETAPIASSRKPLRSTASTALWAHLLRKDVPATPPSTCTASTLPIPPMTPIDKTGTSMRILLHDTQANLEKFSHRVDALTGGVTETKREMATMQKLFQEDRERILSQTVDLGEYPCCFLRLNEDDLSRGPCIYALTIISSLTSSP